MLIQTLGTAQTRLVRVPTNGLALSFPLSVAPNNSAFDMAQAGFTIETMCYVYAYDNPVSPPGLSGSQDAQFLILANGPSGNTFSVFLLVSNGVGYLKFYSYTSGEGYTSPVAIPPESWRHLRIDYNAQTFEMRLFINNVAAGSKTFGVDLADTRGFSLGHVGSARSVSNLYGQLDEFRWWRYVRSDAENAASWRLRNADVTGITPSSMACCYSFEDDNSGKITATYADASGNNLYLQDSGNSSGGQQRPVAQSRWHGQHRQAFHRLNQIPWPAPPPKSTPN